jgi:hypothetical protein
MASYILFKVQLFYKDQRTYMKGGGGGVPSLLFFVLGGHLLRGGS